MSTKNRLQNERSLYLQQHATNPIDWQPWSEEAFKKAQAEDKMILISIGYSSCHWCHVMEKEVFEKEEAAVYLNEHFVCIKVDREERPDVDAIYMTAVQLMTQSGGWPLNCVTLPDGRPIFGGTYFPMEHFLNILKTLVQLFHEDRNKMLEYADSLAEGMKTAELVQQDKEIVFHVEKLHDLVKRWSTLFDWQDGGSKRAPKFPLPNNYEFLLQYGKFYSEEAVIQFTHLTLHKIIRGGIYDQIEGGLMRYSTDMYWKEPHFEKMLYDNGQFLSVLAKAHLEEPSSEYQLVLEQTVHWLETKMKTAESMYKSSIDADADGEEGSYYVWKKEEIRTLFPTDFKRVEDFYQVNGNGFWKNGDHILLRKESYQEFIDNKSVTNDEFNSWLSNVNSQMVTYRNQRIAPVIDEKVIFSWNCMIAIGLTDVALALKEESYFNKALHLTDQLEKTFVDTTHVYRINDGINKINGFLDDYAYYIRLCIQLHQYTLDESWLTKATFWMDRITVLFDQKEKLFYYSGEDKLLISRSIETEDNVIPASNSVLANCYWDLGVLYSKEKWLNQAIEMLQCVHVGMENYGSGYSNWAILLHKILTGDLLVNYIGDISKSEHLSQFRKLHDVVLFRKESKVIKANTYEICHHKNCSLPVEGYTTIFEKIQELLEN